MGGKTIAEGVFASIDRLRWAGCKLRGLRKVDCDRYMTALAHNFLMAARKLGGAGPPAFARGGVASAAPAT